MTADTDQGSILALCSTVKPSVAGSSGSLGRFPRPLVMLVSAFHCGCYCCCCCPAAAAVACSCCCALSIACSYYSCTVCFGNKAEVTRRANETHRPENAKNQAGTGFYKGEWRNEQKHGAFWLTIILACVPAHAAQGRRTDLPTAASKKQAGNPFSLYPIPVSSRSTPAAMQLRCQPGSIAVRRHVHVPCPYPACTVSARRCSPNGRACRREQCFKAHRPNVAAAAGRRELGVGGGAVLLAGLLSQQEAHAAAAAATANYEPMEVRCFLRHSISCRHNQFT